VTHETCVPNAAARLLVALIVATTAAFVVGVLLERHQAGGERRETPAQHADETRAGGNGESGEAHSESGKTAAHKEAAGHVESSEQLLGVDPESTGLLAVAMVVSVVLAAAVWWRGASPAVLAAVAAAMAAFCALDLREVVHQVDESRTGLAVLAGVVAALHGTAALVAARAAVKARGVPPPLASAT
jgi:UDP-N-acetylmuramyl pentapeptide phosphotransferase/UDP-N-acetylglucosamine-1-phosphate transferase